MHINDRALKYNTILLILMITNLYCIKHNRVRIKVHKKGYRNIQRILWKYKGDNQRMKGYAILENIENNRETIVLTFLEEQIKSHFYYIDKF